MATWKTMERGLNVAEYAKQVCKEIGWPYSGNLTLLCDCISSFAYLKRVDLWGGFMLMMSAIENAEHMNVTVDRWYFQDAKYKQTLPTEKSVAAWEVEKREPELTKPI